MAQTVPEFKLDAPKSDNTVRVRMVNTTADMVLHSKIFIEPVVPGHKIMSISDMAFLIENDRFEEKAMFDLGTRKDYWNLPPTIRSRFDKICTGLRIPNDVKDVLIEKSIPLDSINDIVWSHSHWDHTGDTTLFPTATNLVYGAEVSSQKPFYPENPKSPLPAALFEGRKNIGISFPSSDGLTIGGFQAHDFYGDDSFYLLSTPGHAKGHMCGLARTTPDTFILMGGDVCHFPGDLRPNKTYPMPDPIPSGVLDKDPSFPSSPCPASFFLDEHPQFHHHDDTVRTTKQRMVQEQQQTSSPSTTPYYLLSTAEGTAYDTPNPQVAQLTINNLIARFDSASNVFVALAHDPALLDNLPTLNQEPDEDLNHWFERGWKEKCYWGWLNQVARKGKQGRDPIVEGWWRDGKKYDTVQEVLEAGDERQTAKM